MDAASTATYDTLTFWFRVMYSLQISFSFTNAADWISCWRICCLSVVL